MSLLIKGGHVFVDGQFTKTNVYCENGKIAQLTTEDMQAEQTIDASGKHVIPGVIDPHVHFRDPGLTHKEDFLSGSKAAAKGGITTFFDMPNTIPPVTTVKALEEKRAHAKKSVVNYGFHFGAAQDNLQEIKDALEHANIASVKVFMDATTGNMKLDNFDVIQDILKVMPITMFHAENEHISIVQNFLKNTDTTAYIAHTSSESELNLARSISELNDRLFVEVTPHHLFLTKELVTDLKGFAMMKPPLKEQSDCDALWKGIQDGRVNTIGTDHAPHLAEEKQQEPIPFGIPGVETVLPLLLDATHNNLLTFPRLIELCCINPAKIFKIKERGEIKLGFHADITIIDYEKEQAVDAKNFASKCKWSPFDGKRLKGWPTHTIVGGNLVYEEGTFHENQGSEVTYDR